MVMVKTLFSFLVIFFFNCGNGLTQDLSQKQEWRFSGPFGLYDKAQLQRGLKVYAQICSNCHALKFVAFHELSDLGYDEEDIRAFARDYQIQDGPNMQGEIFTRPGQPGDHFPAPFANEQLAAFANGGIAPVDLSFIARARAGGPDYIYALLTGYTTPPPEQEPPEGLYYNPHFVAGTLTAMAPPLSDNSVIYEDGTEPTLETQARDVAAFLMWTADPHMEIRKKTGFRVLIFLIVFSSLLYLVKNRIWSRIMRTYR